MKIALAQLDYHIGNFLENTNNIVYEIKKAQERNVDLVIFSELSVCGYPPLDLLERKEFVEKCEQEVQKIARICKKIGVLIGGPSLNPDPAGKMLFNSAFFLNEGSVKQVFHKSLLPTYDIFDEYRYFEPGHNFDILEFKGKRIAVTICEDLWDEQPVESEFARRRLYKQSPAHELAKQDPDFMINMAASPFSHTKSLAKKTIFTGKAKKYNIPVLYVNQVGAQTQLIFEGGSMAVDARGRVIEQLALFEKETRDVQLEKLLEDKGTENFYEPERLEMIHNALITGIRGYFHKSGFSKAIVGLSGGIDSAVTLALTARALGPENVHSLLLPSQYSTDHSINDSIELCNNLHSEFDTINIRDIFNEFRKSLKPIFGDRPEDVTEENIQARVRATLLMAYSNKFGNILLNTSNKSEAAVGYGTLYGDMSGGLSVLGDVYKTDVYGLARYINREQQIIPENIISKAPSAELRPGQKDSDSLPDYDFLDRVLNEYIEKQRPVEAIIADGLDEELVKKTIRLVNMNEYKRYQTPPILRISSKAFGAGRRIPLVAKY